ncbi:MAG: glycine cleavage system aminomethyltransferase GcvT, partial [Verrucomicrobiae bacterium]|nr:glycine cleavage system aminomethyltransferase GcvT [Verrucomicrobiae bacterium]
MHPQLPLRRTPLWSFHVTRAAKMLPFAGWEMPLFYTGIVEEHHAVRQRVGLFDVSHMGTILVCGNGAASFLNKVLTNDVATCSVGKAQYTLLCNEQGGIRDDLILYRLAPSEFILVVNAANAETDFAYLRDAAPPDVWIENRQHQTAIISLQGPLAAKLLPAPAANLRRFEVAEFDI